MVMALDADEDGALSVGGEDRGGGDRGGEDARVEVPAAMDLDADGVLSAAELWDAMARPPALPHARRLVLSRTLPK